MGLKTINDSFHGLANVWLDTFGSLNAINQIVTFASDILLTCVSPLSVSACHSAAVVYQRAICAFSTTLIQLATLPRGIVELAVGTSHLFRISPYIASPRVVGQQVLTIYGVPFEYPSPSKSKACIAVLTFGTCSI